MAMPQRTTLSPTRTTRRTFYDRDVQAVFWQVVVVGLVVGVGWFLVHNTLVNLESRNIQTGYHFLWRESGFDISEFLIPYSAASTYARALLVGLLNTLRVAIIGVALATVLGIFVGVGTLSQNWLLARITMGYIHLLRNIPVLLQIILWYTILINDRFLPNPRQAEPLLGTYLTQRGLYFPLPEWHVAWLAAAGAFVAALVLAWLLDRWTTARQLRTGQRLPVFWLNLILIIGLPGLAWFLCGAPTEMSMPELRGFNLAGGGHVSPEFVAVLFGLTIYTSAFIGEIVRSGILSVSKGQIEAARALGLKEGMILRNVTLPQALRVIIPPLTSQYLNLTKNSSLSVAVGYPDLVSVAGTAMNQTGQAIEGVSIIMIVYLTLSLTTAGLMNWYNKRRQLVER
jgi:general L-amino acid transport system permease protein